MTKSEGPPLNVPSTLREVGVSLPGMVLPFCSSVNCFVFNYSVPHPNQGFYHC